MFFGLSVGRVLLVVFTNLLRTRFYESLTQLLPKTYTTLTQLIHNSYTTLTQLIRKSYTTLTQLLRKKFPGFYTTLTQEFLHNPYARNSRVFTQALQYALRYRYVETYDTHKARPLSGR